MAATLQASRATVRPLTALFVAVATAAAASLSLGTVEVPTSAASAEASVSAETPSVLIDPAVVAGVAGSASVDAVVRTTPSAYDQVRETVLAAGGTIGLDLPIVDGFAATIDRAVLDALYGAGLPVIVDVDGSVELAHNPPLGEENGDYSYADTVNADGLRAAGVDGSGVGIAVIDTGVTEVADLAGRVVGGVDFSGEGHTGDSFGHGTFIAGLAAGDGTASNGKFTGIAPGAHVVPVKIAGRDGAADVSHVLAAIQWTVSFKDVYDIGVLNLSLGTDSQQPNALSPLNYAVERAWDSGIVVVVSGGNHGEEGPGRIPKPADDPLVITVGATDSNGTKPTGDDTVAAYSSRGPSIADKIVKPDIVAPGSHLVGTRAPGSLVTELFPEALIRDDYMRGSGTSFAAGVTSGAVALLRDAHPDWTPNQIKGAITSTAAPGPVGNRNVDGHGILDVGAAAALSNPAPANQFVVRSTGLGTLAAARGSLSLEFEDPNDPLALLDLDSTTELTAQGLLWEPVTYTTSNWYTSNWYTSNWYTSNWYTSNWYTSNWYTSNWYTSNWYTSNWYADNWS